MQNVWMITGASGGLGKGIAEAALRRGDAVALTSRSPEKLNAMVAEFPKQAMGVKLELDRKHGKSTAPSLCAFWPHRYVRQ